jgi:hypothetical protein
MTIIRPNYQNCKYGFQALVLPYMLYKKTNWDRNIKKKKTIGKFWNFPLVENMVYLIGNFNKKRPHLNIRKTLRCFGQVAFNMSIVTR